MKRVVPFIRRQMQTNPTMVTSCWYYFNTQDRTQVEPNDEYLAQQKEELQRLNKFLDEQKTYDSLLYKFKMLGVDSVQPDAKTSIGSGTQVEQRRDSHTKEQDEMEIDYRDGNGVIEEKPSDTNDAKQMEDYD